MKLMRNILTEIHGGKINFSPENDTSETLKDFQAIAIRIETAKQRGYIKDAKIMRSRSRENYNFAQHVVAIGPLTLEGEQFLFNSDNEDLGF